jgi:hypothetical protein
LIVPEKERVVAEGNLAALAKKVQDNHTETKLQEYQAKYFISKNLSYLGKLFMEEKRKINNLICTQH